LFTASLIFVDTFKKYTGRAKSTIINEHLIATSMTMKSTYGTRSIIKYATRARPITIKVLMSNGCILNMRHIKRNFTRLKMNMEINVAKAAPTSPNRGMKYKLLPIVSTDNNNNISRFHLYFFDKPRIPEFRLADMSTSFANPI
jgi:hypothetical protein